MAIVNDGAVLTIAPPPAGCVPLSYEVRYALVGYANPVVLTATTAPGALSLHLNLWPGESYTATAVGVCAGGALTAPSLPAVFVIPAAAKPPPRSPPPPSDVPYLPQKLWANDATTGSYFG